MSLVSDATGPVSLDAGNNPLTVANTGTIVGSDAGVAASSVAGTLTNAGTILATGLTGTGVAFAFDAGGTLANQTGGIIVGAGAGVLVTGALGEVTNSGSIAGSHGVELDAGGNVVNSNTILGQGVGVLVANAAGSLYNLGSVGAAGPSSVGVDIQAGGTVLNAPKAGISGMQSGVVMDGGTSRLENKGTIAGGTDAVRFLGTLGNRLVVDPTATFKGLCPGGGLGQQHAGAGRRRGHAERPGERRRHGRRGWAELGLRAVRHGRG
jgi:hypothetical protein